MTTLETIFDNINEYLDNIDDLVNALQSNGIIDYEQFIAEVRSQGVAVPRSIREQVRDKFENHDDEVWQDAKSTNTIAAYQSYIDTNPEGKHLTEARENIMRLREEEESIVIEEAWEFLDKTSIEALERFIDLNPLSPHCYEANRLIRSLKEEGVNIGIAALEMQIKSIETDKTIIDKHQAIYNKILDNISRGRITVEQLLEAIRENHNFIGASVVNQLLERGIIRDLKQTGIASDFIVRVESFKPSDTLPAALPFSEVTMVPGTEVYFWGIPSSGKTCAVGAILSSIRDGRIVSSCEFETQCKGYNYMNRLSQVFQKDKICLLPPQTQTKNTYEMAMLVEDHDKKVHPITCVDLAGELVRCMFKSDAHEMLTEEEEQVLGTLTNILKDNRTDNRKLHFFVIEYGAENRLYEGLPQHTYLHAAVSYIKRTGIFEKNTDGIYLLITKVDKTGLKGKELREKLTAYISENYQGFLNGLKKICRDFEINKGEVKIQPFSLGEVCFQDYCRFQDDYVAKVIETIVKRSYCYGTGIFSKIIRGFQK